MADSWLFQFYYILYKFDSIKIKSYNYEYLSRFYTNIVLLILAKNSLGSI